MNRSDEDKLIEDLRRWYEECGLEQAAAMTKIMWWLGILGRASFGEMSDGTRNALKDAGIWAYRSTDWRAATPARPDPKEQP